MFTYITKKINILVKAKGIVFLKFLFFCSICCLFIQQYSSAIELKICANDIRLEDPSAPNTNVSIDILKQAVSNMKKKADIELKIEYMPWSRCLFLLEKGEMDAALIASHKEERAKYLDYPPDAGGKEGRPCASLFKIACSGYVVVTLKSNPFEYKGDVKLLPRPVRVARGYSIVSDLEDIFKNDLEVSKSDMINLQKLLRDKQGSVITHFAYILDLKKYQKLSDQLKIHKKFYVQKSYYIPFSKKSSFPKQHRISLWNEIRNVYSNKELISNLISKYYSNQ
ncbi:hypothetical protein QEJ31_00585 [Pigmentibacter sp. JX0631]|uniref:hypothetical protein n=1 Tax=Pigmentibacter sp. JX0631 TaxID=2976982 RepID=UPI0024682881|nr:hypothetical protein [Pigmentibacter sp. JX0631]WGL60099.1 hypothetical protein QEJ31_00585 [Pigmentibacter sp. JX0631]